MIDVQERNVQSAKKIKDGSGLGDYGDNLSIMIPNYNGAKYIGETISSLKAQGDRICRAQIEILDNCSTDNSEEVVRQAWGDRAKFSRHPTNIGAIKNFNACIARAERQWIHILHSDDFVLPGAYQSFGECAENNKVTAIFARCVFADKDGLWTGVTPILGAEKQGYFESNPSLWRHNPLQCAGVLATKEAYQTVGDFDLTIPFVSDWDMWWRIAQAQTVFYTNTCMAAYRVHAESSSAGLQRTGTNIHQSIKLLQKIELAAKTSFEPFNSAKEAYETMFMMSLNQASSYLSDPSAFVANMKAISEIPCSVKNKRLIIKLLGRYWKRKGLRIYEKLVPGAGKL